MNKTFKKLGIFHSKDADGFFSGAVLKEKFGDDIELLGYDYSDDLPDIESFAKYDEVIMIDITFPLPCIVKLSKIVKLTVIDHHISFKNKVDDYIEKNGELGFDFIFDKDLSACEIGSQHFLGYIPPVLVLVGSYDTWRGHGSSQWEEYVFPFKFYVYGSINHPNEVPKKFFNQFYHPDKEIEEGKVIKRYEKKMDETKTKTYAHEEIVYGGLKGLCMNTNLFSSETMVSLFDKTKHDIMVGYCYNGKEWSVSLRSLAGGVNVSKIAVERGGGGHICASGFEVKNFEDIFK